MNWWYIYKAIFWDELDEVISCNLGMITAESYTDAMEILQEWYGEENINSIQMKAVKEANEPYLLDDNRFNALWEGRD